MNDFWENGFDPSMFLVSSFHSTNLIMNQPETSWHPYTNVPFVIDRNTLSFNLRPWFEKCVVDKIFFEGSFGDPPTVLEISIDNKTVKYQQNSNIITINQQSQLYHKVQLIFDQHFSLDNISKLCVTLIQCNLSVQDIQMPKTIDFHKGKKYDIGPFTEATFDKKYLPKNFCVRKFFMNEPQELIISTNQNYLFKFNKTDVHLTRNKKRYQIKLKCDYPIFHASLSETKILCKSEFTLRGVLDPNYKAEEILNQPQVKFVTETTRVIDFDSGNFKLDNRDIGGELFLKYMIIESDSSLGKKVGMRFQWEDRNAIWDDSENYGADGWITSVVGFNRRHLSARKIAIPFSSNPKSMIPHSYLFMNRCDYFQILTNPSITRANVKVKLCCMQIVQAYLGKIGQVFGS